MLLYLLRLASEIYPVPFILGAFTRMRELFLETVVHSGGKWVTRGSSKCSSPGQTSRALLISLLFPGIAGTVFYTTISGCSSLYEPPFPVTVSWNPPIMKPK